MQSIQHSNVTNLSRTHHIEAALTKLFLLLAQKYFVCMVVFSEMAKIHYTLCLRSSLKTHTHIQKIS